MQGTIRAIVTAAMVGGLATIPIVEAGAVSPGQPTIAFLRQTGTGSRLFQMRPNGTEISPLAPRSDFALFAVSMSPDGERVAMSLNAGGYADLYVQRIGGATKQITDTPHLNEWSPMWSPDGARIVYTEQDPVNGGASIVTRRTDGTGRRVVWSKTLGSGSDASWSPDGTRILLSAVRTAPAAPGAVVDLVTVRPDGTGRRWLTDTPAHEIPGDWSPDGERIAFVQFAPSGGDIVLVSMGAAGGGRQLVSDRARIALMRALYTPDGKRIVLGRYDTGGVELVSTPVGGGVFKQLTETDSSFNAFDMLYLAG
ncbi:MAG: LpqB family beta-propeller domain-containing protein [Actinomycetota bacterium]